MRTVDIALSAGVTHQQGWTGRLFRLMSTTAACNVRMMKGGRIVYEARGVQAGFWCEPEGGFDGVDIDSATAQTVTIAYTDGRGGYDRSAGVVEIQRSVNFFTPVTGTVGTTTATLRVANTARKGFIVRASISNTAPVYIGVGSVGVGTGVELQPGDVWIEKETVLQAIYAISTAANQTVYTIEAY